MRYQLRHAPGLRPECSRSSERLPAAAEYRAAVQRIGLALLFSAIAISLALVAAWSALEGGRAWVIAAAAGALALWMGDLARRAWPRR